MTRPGLVPQVAPCVVSHNLALGGAQIAVLRIIQCLPEWVRERTTLYSQSADRPLLEPPGWPIIPTPFDRRPTWV